MASPVDESAAPHNFLTQDLRQQASGEGVLLFSSLPNEMLAMITEFVNTGATQQEAAAHAIAWGRVSCLTHLMTHEPNVERAINRAKYLDEAIIALGNRCNAMLHGRGNPRFASARAARDWMADPNHARMLHTINTLYFSSWTLKVIPPEINFLRNLQKLCLDSNKITQVEPRSFTGCPALHTLNLENNQITQIAPQAFAECKALQTLYLNNNKITQIAPQTFAGCSSLETLNIAGNQIVQIARLAFAGCSSLKTLDIAGNQIAQIAPRAFADCLALCSLHLTNNKIAHIDPRAFAGCGALLYLFLNDNRITQIAPQAFAGCPSLLSLNLGHNQIIEIAPQAFAGYRALESLFLCENQIIQIDLQAFAGCRALLTLQLHSNQIAQIAPRAFADCSALRRLALHRNHITQIDLQIFTGCAALRELCLDSNKIAQIAGQAFTGCPALRALFLHENPLLCGLSHDAGSFLERFNAFSSYACRSAWAAFYKAVSEGRLPLSEVAECLKHLEERNLIYEMVYLEAKEAAAQEGRVFSDGGDHQWGENHVCDNEAIFYRALKRAVLEKFDRLSAEKREVVDAEIEGITRENGDLGLDDDPLRTGQNRKDNILRRIDAMASI